MTAGVILGITGKTGYDKLTQPKPVQPLAPPAEPIVPRPDLPKKPAQAPSGRVVWVIAPHGRPGDFDGLVRQLRDIKGPSILVLEGGVPILEMLKENHPDVARKLTMKKLNELVQLLDEKGEDAFLKDPLGAALKEILVQHWEFVRKIFKDLRDNPSRAMPLLRSLMEELAKRKGVKLEVEQAPLISFLNQLRGDLSLKETVPTFFKDQQAFLRTLVQHLRFEELSIEQRDRTLGKEQLPVILRNNLGATVIVALGLGHLKGGSFREVYHELGFKEEVVRGAELPNYLKVLGPHRNALLKGEEIPISEPSKLRRELLLYFPTQGLSTLLEGTTVEVQQQIDEMLRGIKEEEIQEGLLANLQIKKRREALSKLASQSYGRFLSAVGLYTIAWLNVNDKLSPAMKEKLPKIDRNLTLQEIDQILLAPEPEEGRLQEKPMEGDAQRVLTAISSAPFPVLSLAAMLYSSPSISRFTAGLEEGTGTAALADQPLPMHQRLGWVRVGEESFLVDAATSLPKSVQIATQENLAGPIRSNFPGIPIRSVSQNPDQAKEDLKDFTVQDGIYRMAVLESQPFKDDPIGAAKMLPAQHAPVFLMDTAQAHLFTPAVVATALKRLKELQLPIDGLYLLDLHEDKLSKTRLTIYA